MSFAVPIKFARLLGAIGLVLAAGCGTLGKQECLHADWQTIGYEDGLAGQPAARIGAHRMACAKYQVIPDLKAYSAGRDSGLNEYCQARNGYRAGLHGQAYHNVCPAASELAFVDAYRQGRQIYDARAELRTVQSQLQSARDALVQADKTADKVKVELIRPDTAPARRLALAQELERLAEERRDREAQIRRLSVRSRELAVNVRELEAQSPFAL